MFCCYPIVFADNVKTFEAMYINLGYCKGHCWFSLVQGQNFAEKAISSSRALEDGKETYCYFLLSEVCDTRSALFHFSFQPNISGLGADGDPQTAVAKRDEKAVNEGSNCCSQRTRR
ncbi:hypothetical protein O6H91_12G014300 [Diphasiastrum complanatum]|uniref:Uncharacterized protein n=1 Tax=Diphasiastrum complanatum TaxID=34168 RepID=A0ACC2C061_DIPCM|nr:hypothetical protein O6H91_12G014300 [Diphasiastrum complanatum]